MPGAGEGLARLPSPSFHPFPLAYAVRATQPRPFTPATWAAPRRGWGRSGCDGCLGLVSTAPLGLLGLCPVPGIRRRVCLQGRHLPPSLLETLSLLGKEEAQLPVKGIKAGCCKRCCRDPFPSQGFSLSRIYRFSTFTKNYLQNNPAGPLLPHPAPGYSRDWTRKKKSWEVRRGRVLFLRPFGPLARRRGSVQMRSKLGPGPSPR